MAQSPWISKHWKSVPPQLVAATPVGLKGLPPACLAVRAPEQVACKRLWSCWEACTSFGLAFSPGIPLIGPSDLEPESGKTSFWLPCHTEHGRFRRQQWCWGNETLKCRKTINDRKQKASQNFLLSLGFLRWKKNLGALLLNGMAIFPTRTKSIYTNIEAQAPNSFLFPELLHKYLLTSLGTYFVPGCYIPGHRVQEWAQRVCSLPSGAFGVQHVKNTWCVSKKENGGWERKEAWEKDHHPDCLAPETLGPFTPRDGFLCILFPPYQVTEFHFLGSINRLLGNW